MFTNDVLPHRSAGALCLAALLGAMPASASIDDLTAWDFYRDPDPGPGALQDAMTGSAAANLAELDFLNDVDVPDGYDIGFSSVNANTVAGATAGYYFDASQDFTISMMFNLTLTDPGGLVAIGLGIGEDRAGVNSAGIGMAVGTAGASAAGYSGAATSNDNPTIQPLNPIVGVGQVGPTYSGSLTVSYDAASGDVTVGAAPVSPGPVPNPPTGVTTFDGANDLGGWAGDDLLVSFFLRSDSIPLASLPPWDGESAEADFFGFTVVEGTPIAVPEPASAGLLALGLAALVRRRRC